MVGHSDIVDEAGLVIRLGSSDEPAPSFESAAPSGSVRVRILWPALGFPATIAPRPQATAGNPFKLSDATRCITLLVLSDRSNLPKEEVARALRYVPWSGRGRRNLPAGLGRSFAADEIEVLDDARKPGLALPDSKDSFGELIPFGGDADGERSVVVILAKRVRDFYSAAGLRHLHEIRISEQASARLADGAYHLFWNNQATGEDVPSDEMRLLLEQFARPRRSKLGALWTKRGKELLDEYEYEYRLLHPWSGQGVKGKRTEILHPLFVDRRRSERLRAGHITDTHVCVRADVYEQNLAREGIKAQYNNWNTSFRKAYESAKRDSDVILLTGDLIDYGRGHWGREAIGRLEEDSLYHEDRNWFLFHDLLASGDAYHVPVYTSLGNHDWRINPYPPFAVAGAPEPKLLIHDHARYSTEEQRRILALAHGRGFSRKFSYRATAESKAQLILEEPGSALKALGKLLTQTRTLDEPGSPTETTVESVAWYLLVINPFFDYAFALPTRHQVLMLDWAEDEDVLFPVVAHGKEWPYMLWQLETASAPGPKAKRCLTPLQQRLVKHLVEAPGSAKLIGMHAPPIGPYSDWLDSDMLAGRKTYTDLKDARGPTTFATRKPDGTIEPWNGHPIFAIRPRSGEAGMEADYGSFARERAWFIKQVADPKRGVRAILSGHIHRNGLYAVHVAGKERGAVLTGEMLVRQVVPPAVIGAKPPAIVRTPDAFIGPLYVNTTSAGPRGNDKSRKPTDAERKTGGLSLDPGYTRLDLSADGTIQLVEFRSALAAASPKPAGREWLPESIFDEIGLGRSIPEKREPFEPTQLKDNEQFASSLDEQLAGLAELVMSAPARGSEWSRGSTVVAASTGPAEESAMEGALTQGGHEASFENELALLESGGSTGQRILPGEPVTWSGETLELEADLERDEDLEFGEADAEGHQESVLDPALMDLAERVMSSGAASVQEKTTWTRCFDVAEITNVLTVYADNAAAAGSNAIDRCSCIVMLNVALGRLLPLGLKQSRARGTSDRRVQMAALTTESIEQAMQQLQQKGFATSPLTLDFLDKRDRTAGTLKPVQLKSSLRDAVLKLSEPGGCWYAYGLSIMDGYHSALLLVDRQEATPKIYWLDQFSNGLDVVVTDSLDQRVTDKTQAWWQSVMDTKGKGYSTMLRVWPLRKPYSP